MLVSRNGQFWVCGAIAFLFNLAGCGAMLPLSDNWCSPTYQCPGAGALIEHTMCTYGPKPPADRCHGLRDVQTDEKRTLIVDSLNAARQQLSRGKLSNWPEAADMREISYDYDLEKIALRWAAQCVKGSDKCRRTRDWPHVGQIVSETASDEPIDTDAYWPRDEIRQWLMEAELADPAAIDAYVPNERSARFTQLIWAETYKVGCADVIYETKDQAGRYRRKVVCNFGPGGNVPGAKIYSTGPICSECPAGVKCICGGHIPVHQVPNCLLTILAVSR
ncbi:unnamed protein product [Nesidiocoris tenuis]|uniref:SCP domain-containing protein n=1 Tax=Nesidiocoris tenuis TaxID=355587 RepID=A0A6H5HA61_9HEMI|nr:unnamed protein product [Nesidiocoris tenuis]